MRRVKQLTRAIRMGQSAAESADTDVVKAAVEMEELKVGLYKLNPVDPIQFTLSLKPPGFNP